MAIIPNKCFCCSTDVQDATALKGHYVCANQRCSRFGLLSVVYLAPPTVPQPAGTENSSTATPEQKEQLKDMATVLGEEAKPDDPNLPAT